MTALTDRLAAYGSAPDLYDPPTPSQCREAAKLIRDLNAAGISLYEALDANISNPRFSGEDMIEYYAKEKKVLGI